MSRERNRASNAAPGVKPKYRIRTPDGPRATQKLVKNAAESPVLRTDRENTKPDYTPKEVGGPKGLEPTRFGDWERDGRCVDF